MVSVGGVLSNVAVFVFEEPVLLLAKPLAPSSQATDVSSVDVTAGPSPKSQTAACTL